MKLAPALPAFLFCALVAMACNPFDVLDDMISYERMNDQESFRPYEARMPGVVPGAVPSGEGEERYKSAPLGSLENPLPAAGEVIAVGGLAYGTSAFSATAPSTTGTVRWARASLRSPRT